MTAAPRLIPQTPVYREMVSGLLRLHRYTAEGRDKSPEYHELCATMEGYWGQLTAVEMERLGGLSEDLYTVSDPPREELEPMTAQGQAEFTAAHEARARGDWDTALALLRKLDKIVPPAILAYLRGTIWEGLDEKQVAVVFHERAWGLDSDNQALQAAFLNVLKWTDGKRALALAEPILAESGMLDPHLVVQAAEVAYGYAMGMSEHDARPVYRRLIGILTPLLGRVMDGQGPERMPVNRIVLLLATCHRWLGEFPEAYRYYSQAVLLEPWDDALLTARGIIQYGKDPSAVADFEQAIQLDSQVVWPYYYMAHHLLSQGRFEDCRQMCERALGKPAPERIQSELCEFLGISLTSLGYPSPVVQRAFEKAIRVDPSNERARENLRRYLTALAEKSKQPIPWDRPSDSSIRTSGLQQIRVVRQQDRRKYSLV